jgi:hypothetical protein
LGDEEGLCRRAEAFKFNGKIEGPELIEIHP